MEGYSYNDIVKRLRVIRAKFLILNLPEKEKFLSALNRIGIEADMRQCDDRNLVDLGDQLDELEQKMFVH